MQIVDGLNEAQREAVTAGVGPILVLAGPGSGKTRVLSHRIAYLVDHVGAPAWSIMAVTFTNKAAREMGARVERLLGSTANEVTLGTFHSTCVRLLRREAKSLRDYDSNFVIFDSDDQRKAIKQAYKDLNLDPKSFPPARILNNISTAKNEMMTADDYSPHSAFGSVVQRVFKRYEELLVANNAMDFDDLLVNTVRMLDDSPEILAKYNRRYRHILVDEFQDTNTVQYELVKRLAGDERSVFAVGDADQSIYKWRGADFRNIRRFMEHFPEARQILLEQNYRSTQTILDAATAVIKRNPDRVHKNLFTERGPGQSIVVSESYNEMAEAKDLAATLQGKQFKNRLGDVAIMYRTNAQSRSLEEAFIRDGIPYRLVGATRFYARKEVKDVIAYLRLLHNPAESISFARVFNTPTRGIGKKSQDIYFQWSIDNGWQGAQGLLRLADDETAEHPFNKRAYQALRFLGQSVRNWIELSSETTLSELMDTILKDIGFREYLDDGTDEGVERWQNVMELLNVTAQFKEVSLRDFLEQVALVSEVDNLEEGTQAATLLTLHAAKGLEFPVVFIIGLEEKMLPHSNSMDDSEELAEERRLFYVGLTRAKDQLFLSYCIQRSNYMSSGLTVPSRFLKDIPVELTTGVVRKRIGETKRKISKWEWSPSGGGKVGKPLPKMKKKQAKKKGSTFKAGQVVRHSIFGQGIVISCLEKSGDEEVEVNFQGLGHKTLLAGIAKLEIIA